MAGASRTTGCHSTLGAPQAILTIFDMREGEVVKARVVAVHEYGLEIEAEGIPGVVQPIELSWHPGVRPSQVGAVGKELLVRVYAITDSRFYASIKQAHPERDPWSSPARFGTGTRHVGRVTAVVDWGATVEIAAGVSGVILGREKGSSGDSVIVEVTLCEPELRKLELKLVTNRG